MSQYQGHGEVGSLHESLTALPTWNTIQRKERPHTRKGSRAIILDNSFVKEILGTREPDAGNSAQQEKPKVPRVLLWLVVVLATLLVLAIILGAVLGTLHSRARSSHPPQTVATTSSAIPTSTSSVPTPTATPQVNSLAVTGWETRGTRGYFTIWLFSQDSDGFLSRSTFNSSTGNWTRVPRFASAKKGTPLAATALNTAYYVNQTNYTFPGVQFQAEVVYLDKLNYVSEWIFPDKGPEEGQPGSLNQQRYTASDTSHLAFYWPELVYQSNGGELRVVNFECQTKNRCWHDSVLPPTDVSNGTQLAMIPLTNNLSSLALFYSQEDGAYVSYIDRYGQASEIWANEAFSNLIPLNASVAAFSTTRARGNNSNLNTYLLWQGQNGTVQMSWSDTDGGWKGPVSPPAFQGADMHTSIACLTGLTFPGFPLAIDTELSRCYFYAGGKVREVSYNGTTWKIVSDVPSS